jgi:hypothetical protein
MEVRYGKPRREGADGDAAEDVPEDEWLARDPSESAACDSGQKHRGKVSEEKGIWLHRSPIL